MELMDEKAHDSFSRGLCPKCGAWKNWRHIGGGYTCKTCGETYIYKGGQLFGTVDKSDLRIEIERQDSLHYASVSSAASVLSAIDGANKEHWIPKLPEFYL